jgi:cell division protein FtsB
MLEVMGVKEQELDNLRREFDEKIARISQNDSELEKLREIVRIAEEQVHNLQTNEKMLEERLSATLKEVI